MSQALDTIKTGEVPGAVSATRFPDVPCNMIKIKALASNSGNVYIGGEGVTIPDGNLDSTSGFELDAGQETGWMPVSNLNRFWRICSSASDGVIYFALL